MSKNLIKYFDPFIGSLGPGDCLCGPYLPNSLARPGPDTVPPHRTSGYGHHDLNDPSPLKILRFSQNHVSGTGGGGRYGNIGLIPFTGKMTAVHGGFIAKEEKASAGYYTVKSSEDDVVTEITSSPRVGVYKFSFPGNQKSNLLIDAGSIIQISGERAAGNDIGISVGGFIEHISDTEVIGRGDLKGGWGHDFPYSVYFCAKYDVPAEIIEIAKDNCLIKNNRIDGANSKIIINFGNTKTVNVQVGISYVSIANARASLEKETKGKSFETIKSEAENIWHETFSKIEVTGGTEDQKTLFYTSFARLICMPSDLGIDDENWLWKSGVRSYTDYYALWDSVRNANSLISLFDPELEANMLNALLDVADHTGWIPDAWIAGHSAHIQGGSSADILFCEAKLKGIEGINYEKALKQMRKNNEVVSPDPFLYGRYLEGYRDLGYVPVEDCINCVSKNIEYAYQDFCIGTLANEIGQKDTAKEFFKSSEKAWNLWRDDLKVFAPKKSDGTWIDPFDPNKPTRIDYWFDPYFYEGTAQEWAFSVLHDIDKLVEFHGGKEGFDKHLDTFFEKYVYSWKEIILHTPYLYHYVGKPHKSVDESRKILAKKYHTGRDGIPDNEDMGCQSAYVMCTSMGLYPIMGQDIYLLTAPLFEEIKIKLGNTNNYLTLKAEGAGDINKYIESVTLNGNNFSQNWISHHDIKNGGELIFKLTDSPTNWGSESPPSPSSKS